MTVQERIKEMKTILNGIYGTNACNGSFIDVSTYGKHNKIVVSVNNNEAFIRERRKGRGIQLMRIVNCINHRFGGDLLCDKTIIIGKDV